MFNVEFALLISFFIFMASWIFIALAIYFIPVIIAYKRKHKNILAITVLTLVLGWTFFGWLASVLWSLNGDVVSKDDIDY